MNKKFTETNLNNIKPNEIWLNMGGNRYKTSSTFEIDDAFVAVKIPNSQTTLITKRINWEPGKVFYPYTPGINADQYPYYCLYQNVVYLCIANNPNNNIAESGNYVTVNPPTQKSSIPFSTEDGYSWISLWYLDYTKETFLNDTDLPIPEFGIIKPQNSFDNLYRSVCSEGITQSGSCCLYYTNGFIDSVSGLTYSAGDKVNYSITSSCYECYELSKKLNLDYFFRPLVEETYELCDSTLSKMSLLQVLEENLSNIAPNTTNGYQLDLLKDYQDHKDGIMRVSIDLSNISDEEKILSTANPYLTIVDPHTTDTAVVRLKTSQIADNQYEVYGIELISSGKNHVLPSHTILDNSTSTALNNSITLYTYINKLFEEPGKVLPINSYIVNAFVNVGELQQVTWNTNFTKIALSGPRINRENEASVVYAPDEFVIQPLSIKAILQVTEDYEGDTPAVPELLVPLESGSVPPLNEDDLSTTEVPFEGLAINDSLSEYQLYVSTVRTGTLISGKNYGHVVDMESNTIPGYYIEINDLTDSSVSPISEGDTITFLGNTCTVVSVEQPILSKRTEYFSSTSVDFDTYGVNPSVNLAFSIKVNI